MEEGEDIHGNDIGHHAVSNCHGEDVPLLDLDSKFEEQLPLDGHEALPALWSTEPIPLLVKAALGGDTEAVGELMGHMEFKPTSREACVALLAAAYSGSVEVVRVMLQAGVDAECVVDDCCDWQPIHVACYWNRAGVVKVLTESPSWRSDVKCVKFRGVSCRLLHLASCCEGEATLAYLLHNRKTLGLALEDRDSGGWTALHQVAAGGRLEAARLLLREGANPNTTDSLGVTPLHAAAARGHEQVFCLLLDYRADPKKQVKSQIPGGRKGQERMATILQCLAGSTLLHWAAARGREDLLELLLHKGLKGNELDSQGRTPLGRAVWEGHLGTVKALQQWNISLSVEDMNWHLIPDEEVGLKIVRVVQETRVCTKDALWTCDSGLLSLAAQRGYSRLIPKAPQDIKEAEWDRALRLAISNNHVGCVYDLIMKSPNLGRQGEAGETLLHLAVRHGNVDLIKLLLMTLEEKKIFLGREFDQDGKTPLYYAVEARRHDIIQDLLEHTRAMGKHSLVTKQQTLLQLYVEQNNFGQLDSAIFPILEYERFLHDNKEDAEKCLRRQLGSSESSARALEQLGPLYPPSASQTHLQKGKLMVLYAILPVLFFYIDIYSDVALAIEYYQGYNNATNTANTTNSADLINGSLVRIGSHPPAGRDPNLIHFILTTSFIVLPSILLIGWHLYKHLSKENILPFLQGCSATLNVAIHLLISPFAHLFTCLENTYAQIKFLEATTESRQGKLVGSTTPLKTQRDEKILKYSSLKHTTQMHVTISSMIEASFEATFQLLLQLYILGSQIPAMDQIQDVTLGSVFSWDGDNTRLFKQVFSVICSVLSLSWALTSHHRGSKMGGLALLNTVPLFLATLLQVVSRAVAFMVFSLTYTWWSFVVLFLHFFIVLVLKVLLEEKSPLSEAEKGRPHLCPKFLSYIRPYFYILLGTVASTLVYLRVTRPANKPALHRFSTLHIQGAFLALALMENVLLVTLGALALDQSIYGTSFVFYTVLVCAVTFLGGLVLQVVYYRTNQHGRPSNLAYWRRA